jgi:hypothetical protein
MQARRQARMLVGEIPHYRPNDTPFARGGDNPGARNGKLRKQGLFVIGEYGHLSGALHHENLPTRASHPHAA